jgi:hypothetical protein
MKNIKIQVWTDLFYARFIAIWRPEEEESFETPMEDDRPDQEKHVPYLLVTSSIYKGREEVIGENPVATSQHPMPPEFLKQQIRHISYMFANEFGIFQPPSKALCDTFLAKQQVGYTKVKEIDVTVSPAQGSITLKDFRDSLGGYTDDELEAIQVMTIGENPDDAHSKGIDDYIYTPQQSETEQYIAINKLVNVYDMENPYIDNSIITEEAIENSLVPGTEESPLVQEDIAKAEDAIADNDADQALLETVDNMEESIPEETPPTEEETMTNDTLATDVKTPLTKEEVQQETIKDLQSKVEELQKTVNEGKI